MNKRTSILSIAAVVTASGLAFAQSNTADQSASSGVPGVEMNAGNNASNGGVPGVEMNVGAQGDQNNIDTQTLGAGADPATSPSEDATSAPRADRG